MSLIEVLVAVLLISFGLLGLISLQARGTQLSVGAEDSQRAVLLANEMAAQMWGTGTVVVDAAALKTWQDKVADASKAGLPNGVGTVTVTATPNGNVARITVQWRPAKAAVGEESRYFTDVLI